MGPIGQAIGLVSGEDAVTRVMEYLTHDARCVISARNPGTPIIDRPAVGNKGLAGRAAWKKTFGPEDFVAAGERAVFSLAAGLCCSLLFFKMGKRGGVRTARAAVKDAASQLTGYKEG